MNLRAMSSRRQRRSVSGVTNVSMVSDEHTARGLGLFGEQAAVFVGESQAFGPGQIAKDAVLGLEVPD